MDITIAYGFAGLSTFTLMVLWFANAYKVLYRKREAVYKAREELRLHQNGYKEKRDSPEEQTARHMFDTSSQIYEQIRSEYNKTIKKPVYRLPGILMGFRVINKN